MSKSTKKIIWVMFTLVLVATLLPMHRMCVKAATTVASGTCGAEGNENNVTWVFDSDGTLTISGSGEMADYDSDTYAPWYPQRNIIKKIVIENISSIGERAFYFCQEEEVVFLGTTLTEICDSAFMENAKLKNFDLPSSVTKIGMFAFAGCKALTKLELPESVTSIGEYCFDDCTGLREIVIPGTIDTIPAWAFGWAYGAHVVIGEGVKSVGAAAFNRAGRVEFPSTITSLDDDCLNSSINVVYGSNSYTQNWAYLKGAKYVDMTKLYDISNADISVVGSEYQYTGKEIKPNVWNVQYKVSDSLCGDVTVSLIEGVDYTVEYKNNIEKGTGSVVITGKGIFTGTKTINFSIYDTMSNCSASLEYEKILYDGNVKTPAVSVKCGDTILVKDTDYTLAYVNNKEEGTAIVTITGKGNYAGSIEKTFSIYKNDISSASISLSYDSVLYDGSSKEPIVTVTLGNEALTKDKDYTVTYKNNTMPGTAVVEINGINQYKGAVTKAFLIEGLSLENAEVKLKESIYSYDGSPKTPSVTVALGDKTLVKDTDYTLTYEDNINDGTAYAVVTGTGIYTDVVKVSFVILPYNAGMDSVYPDGTLIDGNYVYGVTDDEKMEVEVCCPASKNITKVQIPATIKDENGVIYTVTSIGQKAFYKNTKIKSIIVGNNVKSIEDYAFYGCKNVSKINFGKSVEIIGGSSFRKCTKLTSITLPKSIDELGKNAFYGCSKLKTITINANSVVDVSSNAIKGISKKAVIKVPKKLVTKYKKKFSKKTGFKSSMKIKKK